MTLILASIRPHDLVLTADGRSIRMQDGKVVGVDDHYQKLFPIPDHPVVIAHMGENILGGEPVRKFLAKFVSHLNVGDYTISELADELRGYAHAPVRARFKEEGSPRWGVNLWVAGFSYHEERPDMIELFWKMTDDVLRTEERNFRPLGIVPGGDGKEQIEKADWHNINGKSVDKVRAYHHKLMQEATTAKVDPNSVGGIVHELVITREEWRWTLPPPIPLPTQPADSQPTTRVGE